MNTWGTLHPPARSALLPLPVGVEDVHPPARTSPCLGSIPPPPAPLAGALWLGENRSEGSGNESSRVLQILLHKSSFVPRVNSKSFSPVLIPANSHCKQTAEGLKTKQQLNEKSLTKKCPRGLEALDKQLPWPTVPLDFLI